MRYVDNFHYDRRGPSDGKKIVFLHGLMGSWTNWRAVFHFFSDRYEIFSYDQRGHGQSFHPAEGYAPEDYAEDLKRIIDNLKWEKFYLVGHSMGGRNALIFSYLYPEHVEKLVIEDISPSTSLQTQKIEDILDKVPVPFSERQEAKKIIFEEFKEDQTLASFLYSNIVQTSEGQWNWRFSKSGVLESVYKGGNCWAEVSALKTKTLWIRGEHSNVFTQEDYERILKLNSNISGSLISRAGHWVHYEQLECFVNALKKFF